MSFDSSRFSFDSLNDYLGVVAQQGRPQLDSEWNEWLEEMERRTQAGTLDTVGPAAVPSTTPDGFRLTPTTTGSAPDLAIGQGRIYVEGLMAENHGLPPLSPKWVPPTAGGTDPSAAANATWDPALAEIFGSPSSFSYLNQPYFANSGTLVPLPTTGTALFYLDVWSREVNYLQQPDLLEKALQTGTTVTDTTGRFQTVWQVKFTSNAGVTCATELRNILPQSASRLTTDTGPDTGSCLAPPGSGYLGTENRLYRVEIHQGGTQAQASFKWSRDNATVATQVLAISSSTNSTTSLDTLQVQSLGTNLAKPLSLNDWIEITDDVLELNGQPGELHQIGQIQGLTLILSTPLTTPTAFNAADPTRHTRIRRWDSAGALALPASGVAVALEDGITVAFNLDPDPAIVNGQYVSGDYWNFAARTADRSPDPNPIGVVEKLAQAPPRGIHHHYANLALVTFPLTATTVPTDCRMFWPLIEPPSCCCSVQVSPNDLGGDETLQAVVDRFKTAANGGIPAEICLSAGIYCLDQPLLLTTDHTGMTLKGCPGAVLAAAPGSEGNFLDGMVVIQGAGGTPIDITLQEIEFSMPAVLFKPLFQSAAQSPELFAGLGLDQLPAALGFLLANPNTPFAASVGVRAFNCNGLTIEDCGFASSTQAQTALALFWAGVFVQGFCDHISLEGNTFQGSGTFAAGFLQSPSVSFNSPSTGGGLVAGATNFALAGGTVLRSSLDHLVVRDNRFGSRVSCSAQFQPHLTVAALVVGLSGNMVFTENEVANSTAGFWVLSPTQALSMQYNLFVLQGAILAMGYPLPTAVPAGETVTVASPLSTALVFAGTTGSITNSQGTWTPDGAQPAGSFIQVSGGVVGAEFPVNIGSSTAPQVVNTPTVPVGDDPSLYLSARQGDTTTTTIAYTFAPNPATLPVFLYQVRLKFVDAQNANITNRFFDIVVNGKTLIPGFNVMNHTGNNRVLGIEQVFDNIPLSSQTQIVVQLVPTTTTLLGPIISAVEIRPQILVKPPGITPAQSFFLDLLGLVQMDVFGLDNAVPLNLRVEDNDLSTELLPAVLATRSSTDTTPSLLTVFANTLQQAQVDICSTVAVVDDLPNQEFNNDDFTARLLTAPLAFWGINSASVNGNQILNNASTFLDNGTRFLSGGKAGGNFQSPLAIFFDTGTAASSIVGNVLRGAIQDIGCGDNGCIPY